MIIGDAIRVAVASGYHASQGGGVELTTGELVSALRANGMVVEWLAMGQPKPAHAGNVRLPGTDAIYRKTGVPLPLPYPTSLPRLWRAVKQAQVVVAAEANFLLSAVAFALAKIQGKPVLLIQHVGEPSTVSPFARAVMAVCEAIVVTPAVRTADRLVCVSPAVSRYFRGRRPDSVIIGHSLDTTMFRPAGTFFERAESRRRLGLPAEGKLACFVGRLTASKGIEVIGHIARARPDWTFAVAGDGPVDIAAWGLGNIVPLGFLAREDVAALYQACDALLLPSRYESFSLVTREALASGIRVLCSSQIIDTDPALKPFLETAEVDLSRPEETAERFAELLDSEPPSDCEAAREHVTRECGGEAIAQEYATILTALAHKVRCQ